MGTTKTGAETARRKRATKRVLAAAKLLSRDKIALEALAILVERLAIHATRSPIRRR